MIKVLVDKVSKSVGDRMLFSDVTFGVEEGDKIGIVARNGAGKSTFLNVICGLEDYDSGKITFSGSTRVGYLSLSLRFSTLLLRFLNTLLRSLAMPMTSLLLTALAVCCRSSE